VVNKFGKVVLKFGVRCRLFLDLFIIPTVTKQKLAKAAENEEVPFSPVITKSQEKKLAKQNREKHKAGYSTRS